MPETAILLQKSIGVIKGARRAQGRAEGRQGGQEGRQGGQEGRSALLFWPSWNTVWPFQGQICCRAGTTILRICLFFFYSYDRRKEIWLTKSYDNSPQQINKMFNPNVTKWNNYGDVGVTSANNWVLPVYEHSHSHVSSINFASNGKTSYI